jgi:hypothetical protein
MSEKIQKSVDNIREEADNIENEIKPKRVKTLGDPICEILD